MAVQTRGSDRSGVGIITKKRKLALDEFRREIMAFPAGRYSDQVDAFSQALDRAFNRRGGDVGSKFIWGL